MDDGIGLTLLGVPVWIEVADAALRRRLIELWEPCSDAAQPVADPCRIVVTGSPGAWFVEVDEEPAGAADDEHALLRLVAVTANTKAVRGCPDLLVHSACVSRVGTGMALADRSGGGKSTLTAACLAQGWDYVTDEALRLRTDGVVLPYPKPLHLSRASVTLLGLSPPATAEDETPWGAEALGARACRAPVRLSDVVMLQRSASHVEPQLVPLHVAEGFTGLLRLCFNHYRAPSDRIAALAAAVTPTRAWRLHYADALEAAELLTQMLGRGRARSGTQTEETGG